MYINANDFPPNLIGLSEKSMFWLFENGKLNPSIKNNKTIFFFEFMEGKYTIKKDKTEYNLKLYKLKNGRVVYEKIQEIKNGNTFLMLVDEDDNSISKWSDDEINTILNRKTKN
ncbi:MAG: hypothetical protein OEV44_14275 [Spirochaetota bacterium]|nr:hypothetical protein [Spirochaetota bacterium]